MEKVGQIFRKGLLKSVKQGFEENNGTFILNCSALTAAQTDMLRKSMKDLNVRVLVSKNRIAKLALKELEYDQLVGDVCGQTAFAWTNHDAAAVSKALVKFAKGCEGVQLKGGVLDGAVLHSADVQRLADLPAKEVLQAQLLGTMIAPLTRFVGALNAKTRDLLSILKQFSEKKGGS